MIREIQRHRDTRKDPEIKIKSRKDTKNKAVQEMKLEEEIKKKKVVT